MQSAPVIEQLDEVEDISSRVGPSAVGPVMHALVLQEHEEGQHEDGQHEEGQHEEDQVLQRNMCFRLDGNCCNARLDPSSFFRVLFN